MAFEAGEVALTVMTFNIENGGTQVEFKQVIKAIKSAKADVVGIQEAWGNIGRLANALHWKYYDPAQHILSKFPLFKKNKERHYLFIEVTPKHFVSMANIHLPDEPYGPYLIKEGVQQSKVFLNEKKVRLKQAKQYINELSVLATYHIPVFLTGDFNSPSHLDWTEVTLHKQRNHRYLMNWPVTHYAAQQGFVDSYRAFVPNPYAHPGYTWPAKRPKVTQTTDNFNPTDNDLSDRVDFIFASGPIKVTDSQVIGESNQKDVAVQLSPWPSDHRAVVSRFKVRPSVYPIEHMKLTPITGEYKGQKPRLVLQNKIIPIGQPIKIRWENAPGYGYDYISISPIGAQGEKDAVRLYTYGKTHGMIEYSNKNVTGNWTHWSTTPHVHWPLKPGSYLLKLMLDDGHTSLDTTEFKVIKTCGSSR